MAVNPNRTPPDVCDSPNYPRCWTFNSIDLYLTWTRVEKRNSILLFTFPKCWKWQHFCVNPVRTTTLFTWPVFSCMLVRFFVWKIKEPDHLAHGFWDLGLSVFLMKFSASVWNFTKFELIQTTSIFISSKRGPFNSPPTTKITNCCFLRGKGGGKCWRLLIWGGGGYVNCWHQHFLLTKAIEIGIENFNFYQNNRYSYKIPLKTKSYLTM